MNYQRTNYERQCCLATAVMMTAVTLSSMAADSRSDELRLTATQDANAAASEATQSSASIILDRVRSHTYQPLSNGFTSDATLKTHGVADLKNKDWRITTLAVRDLCQSGNAVVPDLLMALHDDNLHVRHVAALTLGILPASSKSNLPIEIIHVHLHLTNILVGKLADLQIHKHKTSKKSVVEHQVHPEMLFVERQPELARVKEEALPQLHQEMFQLVDDRLFEIGFRVSGVFAQVEEFQDIGILDGICRRRQNLSLFPQVKHCVFVAA